MSHDDLLHNDDLRYRLLADARPASKSHQPSMPRRRWTAGTAGMASPQSRERASATCCEPTTLPPFVATARQNELAAAWRDPAARVVVADGAYRSGKTQGAARLIVEEALTRPGLYLVARQGSGDARPCVWARRCVWRVPGRRC